MTGATGNQGGAALRHLIDQGWKVRALTRNPDSESAQVVKALGVDLVQGDFEDRPSLERALANVYGFLCPAPR